MTEDLPAGAGKVAEAYPEVWRAYADLGAVTSGTGDLSARERRLVKLALAIGVGSEGAVHSHARRARAEAIPLGDLRQVALLGIGVLGLPRAVAGYTWIEDINS